MSASPELIQALLLLRRQAKEAGRQLMCFLRKLKAPVAHEPVTRLQWK
jgi:hypothetical protein